jgi:hypothetical protein
MGTKLFALMLGHTIEHKGVLYRMTKNGSELERGDLYFGERNLHTPKAYQNIPQDTTVLGTVRMVEQGEHELEGAVYAVHKPGTPYTYALNKADCVGVEVII